MKDVLPDPVYSAIERHIAKKVSDAHEAWESGSTRKTPLPRISEAAYEPWNSWASSRSSWVHQLGRPAQEIYKQRARDIVSASIRAVRKEIARVFGSGRCARRHPLGICHCRDHESGSGFRTNNSSFLALRLAPISRFKTAVALEESPKISDPLLSLLSRA